MKKNIAVRPYEFDKGFEQAICFYMVNNAEFYGRIGMHLEAGAFADPSAKILVQTVLLLGQQKRVLGNEQIVMQRLSTLRDDGKVDDNQILDCYDFLQEAEDSGLPAMQDMILELAPIIKARLHREAASLATKLVGANNDDFDDVKSIIEKAENLGAVDKQNQGIELGDAAFYAIEKMRDLVHMPTGIDGVDQMVDGGLPKASLGVVVGASGEGKSIFLAHAGATAFADGYHVAYATLELPEHLVLARIIANIADETINDAINGNILTARDVIIKTQNEHNGLMSVKAFTPHATTPAEIFEWVDAIGKDKKRPVDLVLVDYADKLVASAKRNSENGYIEMQKVYEALRIGAVDRNNFVWTASQSRRKDSRSKKKMKDIDDLADSQHKARVADLVITLNVSANELDPELLEVTFFVAKNRTGESNKAFGPMPTNFAKGKMV